MKKNWWPKKDEKEENKMKFLPPAVLKLPADNCLCNCKVLAVAILLDL